MSSRHIKIKKRPKKIYLSIRSIKIVIYIREKIELSIVAQRVASPLVKNLILFILILYMYGALCLKYVSGAQSLVLGISYTFWGDGDSF